MGQSEFDVAMADGMDVGFVRSSDDVPDGEPMRIDQKKGENDGDNG